MEGDIILRPAEPGDAKAIRTAYCEACKITYAGIIRPDIFQRVTTLNNNDIARIENEIATGKPEYYVAEIDGQVAGYISLVYPKAGDYPEMGDETAQKTSFEIEHLYINPDYQNRGIGFALLDKVCREKREEGYRNVIIETVNSGISYQGIPYEAPSLKFYRQVGNFRIIREKQGENLKVSCITLATSIDEIYGKLTLSEAIDALHGKTSEEQQSLLANRYNIRQALREGLAAVSSAERPKLIIQQPYEIIPDTHTH